MFKINLPVRSVVSFVFAMICSAALTGCGGPETTTVTGSVISQGKKVVWGSVILMDSTGAVHQGPIHTDGTYKIDGVLVGAVKIGVTSPTPPSPLGKNPREKASTAKSAVSSKRGAEDPKEKFVREHGGKQEPDQSLPPQGAWFAITPKVADPTTSQLTGQVKSGEPLNIEIKP